MKRTTIAITTMIAAIVLARHGSAQQPGQPGRGGPPNPLLQAFDTDRDGTLSAAEIDAAAAKLRERDTNKDGKLTADELPRGQGGPGGRGGLGRGGPGPIEADSDLSKPPLPKDDGEKQILAALEQARGGERYANVSTADGRLLRQLTESLGAKRVVELGTSTGESGLWFSLALRKTGGKLYTHDIDPRPDRRRPRELQAGRRRRHRRHHRGRRPPDGAAEQGPDRHPLHRRREGGLRRLPQGAPALRPPRRADRRPQHEAAGAQSALRRGDHDQPRPRHLVRAHGRRRGRDHAQEALRLSSVVRGPLFADAGLEGGT
jgi:hypothetical protein